MTPAARFNATLASIVILVMFLLIVRLAPTLQTLSTSQQYALPLVVLVTSAGLYRLLSLAVRWLMERSPWISRKILGAHFVHGTWIGWFLGRNGDKRLTVEHFMQNLDDLVVVGRSFTDQFQDHAQWESEATTLDARKGKLIFTYKMDIVLRHSSLYGINTAFFERDSARDAPRATSGITHDLNDTTRIAYRTVKLSDKLVGWEDALREAKQRFLSSKN